MINEREIEQLIERLVDRIEQANTIFLESIGSSLKQIGTLTPSKAQQLVQILKYGGKYDDIIREIAKYTNLNVADINDIFLNYAKKDQYFYEKFYKYRNIPFTPIEQNIALKTQTQALANIVANEMYNYTRSNVLGYTIKDINGNITFMGLRDTYNKLLDDALLNVGQGKQTFDSAMHDILKQIGESGLKTINYASGRNMRVDSAIRMHLQGRLRELHNENQKIIGDEIQADGVEITVHANPAPDHADAQGRQFSNEEFEKLNNGEVAEDIKGRHYSLDHDNKGGYRPISDMNCKHWIFSIVLGVDKPEYSEEQLKQIIDNNNKGFEYEGKHYTNYEGTQLQRRLETEIRKQKDTQILAKASGNDELVSQTQSKITVLTDKYKELSNVSGLPTKADRLRVSNYKRKGNVFKEFKPSNDKEMNTIGKKYFDFKSNKELDIYVNKTSNIKERIQNGDIKLKKELDTLEPKINELVSPSPIAFKLYSAKDVNFNYTKDNHLLSGTISKSLANFHNRKNKKTITIYVEKGADIISTYNTSNNHFGKQGEIILPTNKNLKRIDKYNYILQKERG